MLRGLMICQHVKDIEEKKKLPLSINIGCKTIIQVPNNHEIQDCIDHVEREREKGEKPYSHSL